MRADSKNDELKILAAAVNRLRTMERDESFNGVDIKSRPTTAQAEVIHDFFNTNINNFAVLGGNQSGKSLLALRIVAWLFNNQKNIPGHNPDEPKILLILSRAGKIIEESLLPKITPMLIPGSYRVIRTGQMVQAIHNTDNGNHIVFYSFENEEACRQRVQSITANLAVIDELPRTIGLMEEVQRRLQAKRGKLILPFTPKIVSKDVRRVIESFCLPYSKRYILRAFDNPCYSQEDKDRILADLASYSEAYRNTVLNGGWSEEGNAVFQFNPETMVRMPENYSPMWRHVECSDPACDSKLGLILLAEEPSTGFWYLVKEAYIEKLYVPTKIVTAVNEITKHHNVVKRVADSAATWFMHTAYDLFKQTYDTPFDKNNRRMDMIMKMQEALGRNVFISPSCTEFMDEINTYHWSDRAEGKIVNSDKFHILDAVRYAIDCLPDWVPFVQPKTRDQALRIGHEKRLAAEYKEKTAPQNIRRITRKGKRWGS